MNTKQCVLIIGGYGEFGGRLAQLLLRDGHSVFVAGRNIEKATAFCQHYGGTALKLDIANDLPIIPTLNVDVVVDAAGPYQAYDQGNGVDQYRVAKHALDCGAHYLDLSDDGAFSQGIASLDSYAKQKNLFALSGASTTPAISGATVAHLKTDLDSIEKIETSILPGCRAPQGRSVMLAILDQVGNPIQFWRNGRWDNHTGWSDPVRKSIGTRINRPANLIMAADALLFPDYFKAKSVLFRAGLEIPIMHTSLQWLGGLRSRSLLPNLTRFVSSLRWMANRITPLGRDTGGMVVEVIGTKKNYADAEDVGLVHKFWCLEATRGQGPFVPAIPARAILRHIQSIPVGARACIHELDLSNIEEAMADLSISTSEHTKHFHFLFRTALHQAWHDLPSAIRHSHEVVDRRTFNGTAKITRGESLITQLVAFIFRFPRTAENIAVQVTKTRVGDKEIWIRDFNGQRFKSTLQWAQSDPKAPADSVITEQFGLLTFRLRLEVVEQSLHYRVQEGSCFGIPLPKLLLPISNSREFVANDTMHFHVELLAPFKLGLIVRYEGWLK